MNDLYFGAYRIEQAKAQVEKVSTTLEAGGFPLTKWMSTDPEIIEDVQKEKCIEAYNSSSTTVKTLGMEYDPIKDELRIQLEETGIDEVHETPNPVILVCRVPLLST